MNLVFMDLEASGLGEASYPIEAAWVAADGERQDSFLINPKSVAGWRYWDEHAEEVHGIDHNDLVRDGISAQAACKRLNQHLQGCIVVTDAPSYDRFWLDRLYEACRCEPSFRVEGLDAILNASQIAQFAQEAEGAMRRHRALADAEDLYRLAMKILRSDT
ncbi:hypothetical protein [Nitrincola alkalilacustris]|uniref:3'-5' exonuclease n=1 Tax=Nitrincola alkalilacustris TaxID=1571224 RepID=UPI00124E2EDC|nr:hypothetical protein [Nitrincola alkalilacustris]